MKKPGDNPVVLHVATALSWRGGEQQVAYLVEELRSKDIKQFVLCSRGSEMEKFCTRVNMPFFTAISKGGFNPSYAKKIKTVCAENKVDIVHTHDSHAHSFAVYAGLLYDNKASIVVSRRVDFPVKNNPLSKYKYNFKQVKKIICVSDEIRRITSLSITDKSKLITVHSGIDTARFDGKADSGILHNQYNIPFEKKIIANVAALAPHKDYFTFVDTVSLLVKKRSDCMYFIIGDGPEKNSIENYIAGKGLQQNIIMTGFRNDIPDILPEIHLMLITSDTEGLGTAILDSFACHVPVVATRAGGIPEIVIHEKTGLLAGIKNAPELAGHVNRLLDDEKLRSSLISGASDHLRKFTCKATAEKTLSVYLDVFHA